MQAKKVIFIIVEGPTDEDALGVIFQRYFDKNTVRVKVIHGDITTERRVNASNILNHIKDIVQKSLKEYKLHKKDLQRIIHLADMDGTFIPEAAIVYDENALKPIYSTTSIKTDKTDALICRNHQKQENLTKLCSTHFIWNDIPYSIFYLSSNLDHVLYNELNLTDKEKEMKAIQFSDKYINDIPAFIEFIRNSYFAIVDEYSLSWRFIMKDLHSLERYSNLGICFGTENDSNMEENV